MVDLAHARSETQTVRGVEPDGIPGSVSEREHLLGALGQVALAGEKTLPGMPRGAVGPSQDTQALRVPEVLETSIGECRDDVSQEPDSVAEVVLGDLLHGDVQERSLGITSSAAVGLGELPDGVADDA